VPGLNPRFLYPKLKIMSAKTYTSSVDMLLCHFIKSFPNFETVFDKISRKRRIIKKKKMIKIFQMLSDVNTSVVTNDWSNYLNIFNKLLKILVKQPLNMFIFFGEGRPKSRWADGVNSDSLALRVRDWTYCAQDRQTWRDLLQKALTRYYGCSVT
jgi:hypothetical protein